MRLFNNWKPSPSMVISSIALFISLGGGAYAIAVNSVGSAQIKKKAIKTKHIGSNQVTSLKIKNKTIKGVDVMDSSLTEKQVAKAADSLKLDGKASTDFVASSKVVRFGQVRLTNGQTQDLLTAGSLKLTARCRINDGGFDFAEILISTTQNGAAFDAANTTTDLTTATAETDRQYVLATAATGTAFFDSQTDGGATAPDGTSFSGGPHAGVNLPGIGGAGTCVFGGSIIIDSA